MATTELDSVAEEAEDLIRLGMLSETDRLVSCERACARLWAAVDARSSDIPLWLDACARLRAKGATPTVDALLHDDGWSLEVRCAAVDAARSVPHGTLYESRFAMRLEELADPLLADRPHIAARALLGVVILDPLRSIPAIAQRLTTWPPEHLDLAVKYVTRWFAHIERSARLSVSGARELHAQAVQLEESLRREGGDASFTYADLLELLVLLAPPASLGAMVQILGEAYADQDAVIRSGAVDAMWVLLHEDVTAADLVSGLPNGAALVADARRAPTPFAYRT